MVISQRMEGEYVITRPDTPRPWVNVISNGDYGTIETQTGSGFSWRATQICPASPDGTRI